MEATTTMGSASCVACGGSALDPWGSHDRHTIFRCPDCGTTGFARPFAGAHSYSEYYPYLKLFDAEQFKWELDRRRARFDRQLEEIETLAPKERTLLDFGAGPGHFCAIARERGWKTTAIEICEHAVTAGKQQYKVDFCDDLADVPDQSLSVITAFHVLEHLEDPLVLLRQFHDKLRPQGVLVVHTPNVESLSSYLQFLLHRLRTPGTARKGSLYFPEHVSGFTLDGLGAVAARAGFATIRLQQCSLFSTYHWPLNFREFRMGSGSVAGAAVNLGKQCARGLVDHLGEAFGKGDWIVGLFRKA